MDSSASAHFPSPGPFSHLVHLGDPGSLPALCLCRQSVLRVSQGLRRHCAHSLVLMKTQFLLAVWPQDGNFLSFFFFLFFPFCFLHQNLDGTLSRLAIPSLSCKPARASWCVYLMV